jgi:ureidoglycolate dehydrogenase (NAD+)
VVAAVNIGLFTDLTAYKTHVDTVGDLLKGLVRADGFDEILVPGEPEDRVHEERAKHGIPLPPGTLKNLRQMSDRFKIPVPPAL